MKVDQEYLHWKSYSTCEEISHKNWEMYSEKTIKSPLLEWKDQEEEKIQGSKTIINRICLSY